VKNCHKRLYEHISTPSFVQTHLLEADKKLKGRIFKMAGMAILVVSGPSVRGNPYVNRENARRRQQREQEYQQYLEDNPHIRQQVIERQKAVEEQEEFEEELYSANERDFAAHRTVWERYLRKKLDKQRRVETEELQNERQKTAQDGLLGDNAYGANKTDKPLVADDSRQAAPWEGSKTLAIRKPPGIRMSTIGLKQGIRLDGAETYPWVQRSVRMRAANWRTVWRGQSEAEMGVEEAIEGLWSLL